MPRRPKLTITLVDKAAIERLRDVAKELGFVNQSGPNVGGGSVSGLAQSIADGAMSVWPRRSHDERIKACKHRVRLVELRGGDPLELRLAKASLALAEASAAHDALDTPEQRGSAEARDAWLAYVRADAEHGAALLSVESWTWGRMTVCALLRMCYDRGDDVN